MNKQARLANVAASSVVELVRDYPEPAAIRWRDVDVEQFLRGCDAHRVAGLLGPTLAATSDPPAVAVDHYRMVSIRRKFAHARLVRDLNVVDEALAAADVAWVVLKGPALVAEVYREGARESSDLDLLVDGRQLGTALDALVDSGAVLIDQNFNLLRSMGSGEIAISLPNGTVGDLHWHPIHQWRVRKHFAIDVAAMLARRQSVDDNLPVPTLDATDSVLYLCLHACLSGGDRLLWAKDIDLAVRRLPWSPTELVQRARRTGTTLPTAAMLRRTAALMGTPLDIRVIKELAGRSWWIAILRVGERVCGRRSRRTSLVLRLMYRCTRETSAASLRELARASVYNSVLRRRADPSRPWRRLGPGGEHPAFVPSAPDVRDAYLDDVRREIARRVTERRNPQGANLTENPGPR